MEEDTDDVISPKILVALNICQKYLLDFGAQLDILGVINGELCSD